MDFTTILDISSIIWDEDDFQDNTSKYFGLVSNLAELLEKIENAKSQVLLRTELFDEIVNGFPFDKINNYPYLKDFRQLIYSSLINIGQKRITYDDLITPNTTSKPNLIKPYYNGNTQNEIKILISRLHKNEDNHKVYFTFNNFWEGGESNLTTIQEETEVVEHKTIISDSPNVLDDFLLQFKRIFEHNDKHDRVHGHSSHGGEDVSILSCFDGENHEIPQDLLDRAFDNDGGIYSFDVENNVYVIFRCHKDNLYHGYDEPDINRIPKKVKDHFKRW